MKQRVIIVMPVLALALIILTHPASASPGYNGHLFSQTAIPDSDGDTIPDEFDMDDDNDGVIDFDDPAPLDPALPGANVPPAPQPGSSISDVDGDGLSDDLDLDDDSDGVIDVGDPQPSNPVVPGGAPPAAPNTEVSPTNPGNQPVPVVTSLPSTGGGAQSTRYLDVAMVVLLVTGISTIAARVNMQPNYE